MSNDFIIDGSIVISNTNTPTREGQRIASLNDLETVPTPFVGMIIFVEDSDQFIYVKSLKNKNLGGFEIENALIDEYTEVFPKNVLTRLSTVEEKVIVIEEIQAKQGELILSIEKAEGTLLLFEERITKVELGLEEVKQDLVDLENNVDNALSWDEVN